jgi:hypothetical protein
MGAVTYFIRMVAKEGKAEEVQQLLLENPRRIEQGEPGNLAFGVHRSIDNPNEFWLYETLGVRGSGGSARERRSVSAVQGGATPTGRPRQRAVRQMRPG